MPQNLCWGHAHARAGITPDANFLYRGLMHGADWLPTLSTVAGYSLDGTLPLDGVDQWGYITGTSPLAPQYFIFLAAWRPLVQHAPPAAKGLIVGAARQCRLGFPLALRLPRRPTRCREGAASAFARGIVRRRHRGSFVNHRR